MSVIQVKDLLEAGVHFGHRVSRWNPKMKPFIYGKRNLIHIINLKETIRGLVRAHNFLFKLTSEGGEVLYVGTKRQAKSVVFDEAKRSGMHFVTERWLGGTLTNFTTIRERLKRLEDLQSLEETGAIEAYSKKAQSSLMREKRKIARNLSGITKMTRLPDALIIIDQRREKNALLEADKLGIPVICILDTDCDPDLVDICIPGNEDAMRSVQILLNKLTDAVVAGRQIYHESGAAQEKAKEEEDRQSKDRHSDRSKKDNKSRGGFRKDNKGNKDNNMNNNRRKGGFNKKDTPKGDGSANRSEGTVAKESSAEATPKTSGSAEKSE